MLDWFSRGRMSDEREEDWPALPGICQFLPNFTLQKPDGTLFVLSTIASSFALFVLPSGLTSGQTYLLWSLAKKLREVRPEITRVLVVTRPEHLSTVVASDGDMLFLSDLAGEVVLQLAPHIPLLYLLDADRQIIDIVGTAGEIIGEHSPFVTMSLRPAA